MKNSLLYLYVLLLFSSCSNGTEQISNKNKMLVLKQLSGQLILGNNMWVRIIEKHVLIGGGRQVDKRFLADSKKLEDWRNRYVTARSKNNLLNYSGAMLRKTAQLERYIKKLD